MDLYFGNDLHLYFFIKSRGYGRVRGSRKCAKGFWKRIRAPRAFYLFFAIQEDGDRRLWRHISWQNARFQLTIAGMGTKLILEGKRWLPASFKRMLMTIEERKYEYEQDTHYSGAAEMLV